MPKNERLVVEFLAGPDLNELPAKSEIDAVHFIVITVLEFTYMFYPASKYGPALFDHC